MNVLISLEMHKLNFIVFKSFKPFINADKRQEDVG